LEERFGLGGHAFPDYGEAFVAVSLPVAGELDGSPARRIDLDYVADPDGAALRPDEALDFSYGGVVARSRQASQVLTIEKDPMVHYDRQAGKHGLKAEAIAGLAE